MSNRIGRLEGQMSLLRTKKERKKQSHDDVSVCIHKCGRQGKPNEKRIVIYFRNGKEKLVGNNFDIMCGYGILAFIPQENGEFYFYRENNRAPRLNISKSEYFSKLAQFEGNYDLLKDKDTGNYYICRDMKKEEEQYG